MIFDSFAYRSPRNLFPRVLLREKEIAAGNDLGANLEKARVARRSVRNVKSKKQ
jgi:hypothetical protein